MTSKINFVLAKKCFLDKQSAWKFAKDFHPKRRKTIESTSMNNSKNSCIVVPVKLVVNDLKLDYRFKTDFKTCLFNKNVGIFAVFCPWLRLFRLLQYF